MAFERPCLVFADMDGIEDLSEVPPMASGHRGVRLGRRATDRVVSIVNAHLNPSAGG